MKVVFTVLFPVIRAYQLQVPFVLEQRLVHHASPEIGLDGVKMRLHFVPHVHIHDVDYQRFTVSDGSQKRAAKSISLHVRAAAGVDVIAIQITQKHQIAGFK